MPYQTQLKDAKASGPLRTVAGVCPNSDSFRDLVNEVQERLWRRGNWWDSAWTMTLCLHSGCVTWPRWAGTVLGIRLPNNPTVMQNRWFSITGRGYNQGNSRGGSGWGGGTGWGMFYDAYSQSRPDNVVIDAGTAPTFNDIKGNTGKLIRYYARNRADLGKTIKIYGLAYGNQPLQEKVNGIWEPGITITAAAPFGTHPTLVTKIESITREATTGMTYLFSYDSTTQVLLDLGQYEPSETNPRYRRSQIQGYGNNRQCGQAIPVDDTTTQEREEVQIEALVKLQFIPAISDNDFLFIDIMPALKLGIQAVKLEEMNQDDKARVKWLEALDEMNMEDRDKVPQSQTVVVESVIGGGVLMSPT